MTKEALLVVAGFFGCCLSSFAQETQRSDLFALRHFGRSDANRFDLLSTVNRADYGFRWASLADARRLSLSTAYNWFDVPRFLPVLSSEELPKVRTATKSRRDTDSKAIDARRKLFDYAGGEVGVLYGRSTGSSGIELKRGYIFGEAGNDKTHISAGVFYEEVNGR